jgi:pimeloyl-ACP methyl ester carboxylesterase
MPLLAEHYQVYAVDLRGQGRSSWTPGRYTLDNIGNDLVRFLDLVVGRPAFVSGLSSGGVLSAWLAAYAKPGQIRAAVLEDPPLFSSEVSPAVGHSVRQSSVGPIFQARAAFWGDQWSVGDLEGYAAALPHLLPAALLARLQPASPTSAGLGQNLREYDPEWARSVSSGLFTSGCDHLTLLQQVKVPVLFTHHFRQIDEESDYLVGAISDVQVAAVRRAIGAAGQPFTYQSFPTKPHALHSADPELFAATVHEWLSTFAAHR